MTKLFLPVFFYLTVKWLRKQAEQGDALSQCSLAALLSGNYRQDYNEAVQWYTKAAEQGYWRAQFELSMSYKEGKGVAKDDKEAVYWLTKSADQGVADAKKELEDMKSE